MHQGRRNGRLKKIAATLAIVLTLAIIGSSVALANQPPRFTDEFAGDGFAITFVVNSNWYNNGEVGYNAEVRITNTSAAYIVDWELTSSAYLGLADNFHNGAHLVSQGDSYSTLGFLDWNRRIAPGASHSIWLYSHSTNAPEGMTWQLAADTAAAPPANNDDADDNDADDDKDANDTDDEEKGSYPVSVQFRNPNLGNLDYGNRIGQLDPWFRITAHSDVYLPNLVIRYFYNINGDIGQTYVIDWASINSNNIIGSFIPLEPAVEMADYIFELGFSGGTLRAGQTAYINARIFKDDHSHFFQDQNFSFAGADALAVHIYWEGIAVFYDGELIFGTTPCGETTLLTPDNDDDANDDDDDEDTDNDNDNDEDSQDDDANGNGDTDTDDDDSDDDANDGNIEAYVANIGNVNDNDDVRIRINGVFVYIPADDQQPLVIDGRTLVPMRAVMEAMGFTVNWDRTTQTATLVMGDQVVIVEIGSLSMSVNGEAVALDVPAQTHGGRIMVPLRAIGEAVGMRAGWDRHSQIADLTN